MSDRVLVMHEGRMTGIVDRKGRDASKRLWSSRRNSVRPEKRIGNETVTTEPAPTLVRPIEAPVASPPSASRAQQFLAS